MMKPYIPAWTQEQALDAVEHWIGASGLLFREFGSLLGPEYENSGRIDGLIVPTGQTFPSIKTRTDLRFWNRFGLVGVEIKLTRADFLDCWACRMAAIKN